ncbi:MAG: EF-hand domain-containing protein, partial [Verrucomicrobiae bacterium]|nr:EF-hand domain-containing protein [Verrucomicrobiae bacterium]
MKTSITFIIALAAITTASAQAPGGVFQRFDRNGDGKVTTDELPNQQAFDRFDTNKDGSITLEEYNAVTGGTTPTPATPTMPPKPSETPTAPADAIFSGYDTNADGKVTKDELANEAAFQRFDLDKDGAISLAEYNKVSGKPVPTTPGTPTPPGTPPTTPGAGGGMAAQIENMIKAVDKNADGQITKEEAGDAPWFARLDQDGNGVISAEELEMMRKIVAKRGGAGGGGSGMPSNAPTITPEDVQKVTSGPEVLKPGDVGIGRMMDDIAFSTLEGKNASLSSFKDQKGLVI